MSAEGESQEGRKDDFGKEEESSKNEYEINSGMSKEIKSERRGKKKKEKFGTLSRLSMRRKSSSNAGEINRDKDRGDKEKEGSVVGESGSRKMSLRDKGGRHRSPVIGMFTGKKTRSQIDRERRSPRGLDEEASWKDSSSSPGKRETGDDGQGSPVGGGREEKEKEKEKGREDGEKMVKPRSPKREMANWDGERNVKSSSPAVSNASQEHAAAEVPAPNAQASASPQPQMSFPYAKKAESAPVSEFPYAKKEAFPYGKKSSPKGAGVSTASSSPYVKLNHHFPFYPFVCPIFRRFCKKNDRLRQERKVVPRVRLLDRFRTSYNAPLIYFLFHVFEYVQERWCGSLSTPTLAGSWGTKGCTSWAHTECPWWWRRRRSRRRQTNWIESWLEWQRRRCRESIYRRRKEGY